MDYMKLKKQITLYNSYFDKNDNLSAKAILNIFQDVAAFHAEEIGVGYEEMLKKNLYWILTRIKFDIIRKPEINETVVVKTWPHEKGKVDFDRDFKISTLQGDELIIGTSKWCVINTTSRSLQRTDNVEYNGICLSEKNYEEKFNKIQLPEIEGNYKFSHTVQFSDLDHNNHMNNTNYANLVLNAVNNKNFSHFEINFLNECLLSEIIDVFVVRVENKEYVVGKVNGKLSFVCMVE